MARRSPPTKPPAPKKSLTVDEMRAGITRIAKRLEELDAFNVDAMRDKHPPELTALSTAITRALEKTFGEATSDFQRFSEAGTLSWRPMVFTLGEPIPLSEYQDGVRRNIDSSRALLKEAIRTLEEDIAEAGDQGEAAPPTLPAPKQAHSRRVFVVHGHDEGARETVARFLEKIDLTPVILHEQPNKGRTIITKFREEAADIGFAIVLMTPDDFGGRAGSESKARARQNVVFELGFFIGSLGPERVAALVKGEIERPSDFDGVVYISLEQGNWKVDLGKELSAAGLDIDWNKVMR